MRQVQHLMTVDIHTVQPEASLYTVRKLMERESVRHIPVVDADRKLLGLVSQRDVLAAGISHFAELDTATREEIECNIPVSAFMAKEVIFVQKELPLTVAASILLHKKFSCLPVLDQDKVLCGILTEFDFVRLCLSLLDAE